MTEDNRLRLLYHYTSRLNVANIFAESRLRTSRLPHSRLGIGRSVAVVWLTDAAEPGRGHDHGLSAAEPPGAAGDRRAVRFTVSVDDAQYWPEWALRRGIGRRTRRELDEAGGGLSARWWVVPRAIDAGQWVRVDDLVSGERIWPEPSGASFG